MGGESYNDSIKEFGRVIEEQVDNKQSLFMRGNGNIDTDYYFRNVISSGGNMRTQYQKLLELVRQNYVSVVWTHKIQEKQADIYEEKFKKIECANIFTAAITSCGIFSTFYQDYWLIKVCTILFSFITVFIASYMKSFDLKTMGKENKEYANRFLVIRNKLLNVIAEIHLMKKPVEEIQETFEVILNELNDCYINAPTTTEEAVFRASRALDVKQEYTFTDEEIDRFLPDSLRGGIKDDDIE